MEASYLMVLMYFSASVTSSYDPMRQGTWSWRPLGTVSNMRPVPVDALPPALLEEERVGKAREEERKYKLRSNGEEQEE